MLKTGEIIFNNQSSLDLNLRMEEYPVIDMLQQDYEQVDVIGRNGSIFINKGSYRNRTAQCNLEIFTYDYNDTYEKVLDWLYNIEDDRLLIDSDYKCYRVEKVELTTTQKQFQKCGSIPVNFICKPFRTSYEYIELPYTTTNNKIYNHGDFEAPLVISFKAKGDVDITINDDHFFVKGCNGNTVVDSEVLKCINTDNKLNVITQGNYPSLQKGLNTIVIKIKDGTTGTLSNINIKYLELYR